MAKSLNLDENSTGLLSQLSQLEIEIGLARSEFKENEVPEFRNFYKINQL